MLQPAQDGNYTVIGIFTRNGKKQDGVLVGYKLVKVGDLATKPATFGAVIDALHGPPGATRTLLLERDGKQFTITARSRATGQTHTARLKPCPPEPEGGCQNHFLRG